MATNRNAGKSGDIPVVPIKEEKKANNLKVTVEEVVEIKQPQTVKEKFKRSKTSTQDNQLLGGN